MYNFIPGAPIAKYRKLTAAIDSPVGVPVKGEVIGLGRGYRDPTRFRYSTFPKPNIDVCPPVSFERSKLYIKQIRNTTFM